MQTNPAMVLTDEEYAKRKEYVCQRFLRIARNHDKPMTECVAAVDPEVAFRMIKEDLLEALPEEEQTDPHHVLAKLGPAGKKFMGV